HALIALAAGLWVRRTTWFYKWESAATVNLAGILVGLVCMMPFATPTFDCLHRVTGVWNLEDMVGHIASLTGITVFAYVTLNRLELTNAAQWRHWRLELPATFVLPTLVGLFVPGSPDRHVRDLFTEPPNAWLAAYWVVLSGAALWVLGHLLWALAIIARYDADSSTMAKIYLAAVSVNCWAVVAKLLSMALPGLGLETAAWVLICVSTVGYVLAAMYGMRQIKRWLAWPPPPPKQKQWVPPAPPDGAVA
ncbi:hypothetical protein, partial [Mycobacterium sp. 1245801.1]|uniref:hypothetical protein n=1 Tax=Mycobacterium sp. 1245801.1 TaxID=1834075 RepID=UPI000A6CEF9A